MPTSKYKENLLSMLRHSEMCLNVGVMFHAISPERMTGVHLKQKYIQYIFFLLSCLWLHEKPINHISLKNRPIGVMQCYTPSRMHFSQYQASVAAALG